MNTVFYAAAPAGAVLILLDGEQLRLVDLESRGSWLLGRRDPGRTPSPDIEAISTLVSREHGWFKKIDGQWFYVDNPRNMNGTYHNGIKLPRPVYGMRQPVPLEDGDVLRIDNDDPHRVSSRCVQMLFTSVPIRGSWRFCRLPFSGDTFIGRSRTCQICEPLPYLSGRHARITALNGEYYLSDCGSQAGTFLNGQRITGSVRLQEKDCISICDCRLFFLGNRLLYTSYRNA